ncbi:root meristem growth factor 10 [Lycium ferocissimum]|uniref:root meristem growth factor 10 n=1 Tax=Lycium ferocissimum TaxID=112874 RepID=UPI002814EA12|nr:root meristem growth factor 10 [Lycium ferocissimum]
MSINKITLLMMVFLLFHACNARSLGVLNKNEEKPNVARVSSSPSDVKVKPSSAEPNSLKENEKDHQLMEGSSSSNYGVSVSWRIHHQKREDPPPEFNLDYLPARTHPPVHN